MKAQLKFGTYFMLLVASYLASFSIIKLLTFNSTAFSSSFSDFMALLFLDYDRFGEFNLLTFNVPLMSLFMGQFLILVYIYNKDRNDVYNYPLLESYRYGRVRQYFASKIKEIVMMSIQFLFLDFFALLLISFVFTRTSPQLLEYGIVFLYLSLRHVICSLIALLFVVTAFRSQVEHSFPIVIIGLLIEIILEYLLGYRILTLSIANYVLTNVLVVIGSGLLLIGLIYCFGYLIITKGR